MSTRSPHCRILSYGSRAAATRRCLPRRELFDLDYDLLLYDITSTYFEGEAKSNPLAKHGYSRDHRGDCKQVTIALVVDRNGIPLAYEVFAGNRHDSTTVEEIGVQMFGFSRLHMATPLNLFGCGVELVESRYGKAGRIWAMDRGMASEDNMDFLKEENRRYILGTPKSMLKKFERELLSSDWREVHDGLEVKLCAAPDGNEMFILCRSSQRREKEKAMHERFEQRIEKGLEKIASGCGKRRYKTSVIERRVGRLLERNSRAAGLFDIKVKENSDGRAEIKWKKLEKWRDWATLSEGCYLLRTNITDWSGEDLWKAYIQLTEAEAAFRIHKNDLSIRPIWHQREDRVKAHIFVCFLAYVLWKTLAQLCRRAGLGDEPRRVFEEIGAIQLVDVVFPTKTGKKIRKRCITSPSKHQSILLDHLGLILPKSLKKIEL
jgi:transposase